MPTTSAPTPAISEEHRVTPPELFLDVVYVFAFTEVTHLAVEDGSLLGVLRALAVFGVLWWSWASYAWLANQLQVGRGIGRIGTLAAVVLVFLLALAIPEAFHGLAGPLIFAVGFIAVSVIYTVVTLVAAGADARLRMQVLIVAVGLATALREAEATAALGGFGAVTLGGGLAVYLAATAWFERIMTGRTTSARGIAALLAVISVPALAAMPVLLGLLLSVVIGLSPAIPIPSARRGQWFRRSSRPTT